MRDLGKSQKDYAVYLPAISSFYVKQVDKIINKVPEDSRTPAGFEHGNEGLDFLKDKDTYLRKPGAQPHRASMCAKISTPKFTCTICTKVPVTVRVHSGWKFDHWCKDWNTIRQ